VGKQNENKEIKRNQYD